MDIPFTIDIVRPMEEAMKMNEPMTGKQLTALTAITLVAVGVVLLAAQYGLQDDTAHRGELMRHIWWTFY